MCARLRPGAAAQLCIAPTAGSPAWDGRVALTQAVTMPYLREKGDTPIAYYSSTIVWEQPCLGHA